MATGRSEPTGPFDRDDPLVRLFLAYARLLARYHGHRVLHLERLGTLLRKGRRVVLVGNHALDVLDPLLFTAALIDRYGRLPHFIGHENLIFRLPGLGAIARRYQMIPSRRMRETAAALRTTGLLMLYPGSGSEAARRSYRDEPYRLKWENRLGFLQLALRYDAEILFVAAVGIDEMYYQSSLKTPAWILRRFSAERYEGSRMQFGVLGPHLVPTLAAVSGPDHPRRFEAPGPGRSGRRPSQPRGARAAAPAASSRSVRPSSMQPSPSVSVTRRCWTAPSAAGSVCCSRSVSEYAGSRVASLSSPPVVAFDVDQRGRDGMVGILFRGPCALRPDRPRWLYSLDGKKRPHVGGHAGETSPASSRAINVSGKQLPPATSTKERREAHGSGNSEVVQCRERVWLHQPR